MRRLFWPLAWLPATISVIAAIIGSKTLNVARNDWLFVIGMAVFLAVSAIPLQSIWRRQKNLGRLYFFTVMLATLSFLVATIFFPAHNEPPQLFLFVFFSLLVLVVVCFLFAIPLVILPNLRRFWIQHFTSKESMSDLELVAKRLERMQEHIREAQSAVFVEAQDIEKDIEKLRVYKQSQEEELHQLQTSLKVTREQIDDENELLKLNQRQVLAFKRSLKTRKEVYLGDAKGLIIGIISSLIATFILIYLKMSN